MPFGKLGAGFGKLGSGGRRAGDPLAPGAPVLTWDTAGTDNTPTFTGDFDDTHVWASGSIDGSNYDVIEFQWSTSALFTAPGTGSNTLDAAELLAGTAAFTTGALANGTWYARARHNHVVAGANHYSPWSNTVTQTIAVASATLTYRASGTSAVASATVATYSIDIGTASVDRLVSVGLVIQNTSATIVSLVVNGVTLTQDATFTGGNIIAFYSGLVPTGSGAQTITLNTTNAAFLERDIHVWTMTGLASSTKINSATSGNQTFTIGVTLGDFLIAIDGINGANTRNFNSSTETPAGNHTTTWLLGSEWTIAATNASFSVTSSAVPASNKCAVSYH